MKQYIIIFIMLSITILSCKRDSVSKDQTKKAIEQYEHAILEDKENSDYIVHSVFFNLQYDNYSEKAKKFLQDGNRILSSIPQVKNFKVLSETSSKNQYHYGFYMEFENQAAYDAYNVNPAHERFVEERWKKEVTSFIEIDYKRYNF